MRILRQWKLEAMWLLGICVAAVVLTSATPAYADEMRHYSSQDNWCYREEPLDCLWSM